MVKYNYKGALSLNISGIFEAGQQYDALNNKHDKGYKFLLSSKRVSVELLQSFVKQGWVDKIDESKMDVYCIKCRC